MYPTLDSRIRIQLPPTLCFSGQVGNVILVMKTCSTQTSGTRSFPPVHRATPLQRTDVFSGFRPAKNIVFSGVFPINSADHERLSAGAVVSSTAPTVLYIVRIRIERSR
ncbi:hypothetical protein BJ742DRAFT_784243 [Cladochytrium replicatum]|nr:hypothetical protein BJ742DRAFT_784243 [Cladochytrium replicatum]